MLAIKFAEQDEPRGMDMLLHLGPAQLLPGLLYLTTPEHLDRASPSLHEARISFAVRRDLPRRLTVEQARELAEGVMP